MSKRTRKVAFDEEVDLAEKRRREEELHELEHEEKRGCALFGKVLFTPLYTYLQNLGSKLSILLIAMKKMNQILYRRVAWGMKISQLKKTQPL